MDIMGLQNRTTAYDTARATKAEAKAAERMAADKTKTEETATPKTDEFVNSGETGSEQVTYKKPSSGVSANQLMEMERQRTQSFQSMIQSMVVKQGQASNLTLFGMQLNVSQQQSADAAASIAEGGEYSVDAVAGRIMDMAKALAGGDESKLDKLRTAVQKGFKAAGVEFGQKMPDITNQTYNEVMKRFDDLKGEHANKTGATSSAE